MLRVIDGMNKESLNAHYVIKNFTINETDIKIIKGVYNSYGMPLILDTDGSLEFIALDRENFLIKEKEIAQNVRGGTSKIIGYNYTHYSYKDNVLCKHYNWYYSRENHYKIDPLLNRKDTLIVTDIKGLLYLYNYKTASIISLGFTSLSNEYLSHKNLLASHNVLHFQINIQSIEDTNIKRILEGFITLDGTILKEIFDNNGNIYESVNNNLDNALNIIYRELEEEERQKKETSAKKILTRQKTLELLDNYKK